MTERTVDDRLGRTDDPALLSATDMAAAFRAGTLSPVEATRAVLERIDAANQTVNAYCLVDADYAIATARQAERRWLRFEPLSAIDGVPSSIKDLLLTKGWPTLRGSHTISPDQGWNEDAPAVARMREAGAVFVGKTTTPELGWKGVTDAPLTGVTRNPWDPSTTSGGSSGGAAAAVASGMGPLALGTDGGGSVRIPAGFCGVFGFKPTYGTVPLYPSSPFGNLAHVGPLTWTVEDTAVLLDVICRPDPRDWSAGPPPTGRFAQALLSRGRGDRVAGMRIAYSPDLGYARVDDEVAALVEQAAAVFTELGAQVERSDPGFSDPVEAYHVLWFVGAAASIASLSQAQRATMDPGLIEIAEQGTRYSAVDYVNATGTRTRLGALMGQFHQRYDLLITPTLPIPAFTAGQEVPDGATAPRWTSWTPFTYPFNLTQQPAATVPCGFTRAGLPVGLQIVGPRHADARVLAACHEFATARPWQSRRPQ